MSRRGLDIYQYLAPVVLSPLSFWLWWKRYEGNFNLVLVAWLIPILYAYIVPGVGTNLLKVWEFNTRFRLGRFRPHHGFVFGSATAMLAWLGHGASAATWGDILRCSLTLASMLGFWNLLYEVKALRSGLLLVYNQPWAEGHPAEAIALDYSPWFFAGFGAIYGAGLGLGEYLTARGGLTGLWFLGYFLALLIGAIAGPVLGYRAHSFRTHGHSGCRPVPRKLP